MTFDVQESSREDGAPISLYFIRYGKAAKNYYAYTDHTQPITLGQGLNAITYQPINISYSGIRRSVTLDNAVLVLSTPSEIPLASRFRAYPPSEVISVTIRQGHVDNPDYKVCWVGRVLGHKDVEDGGSEFQCEPRSTSLSRTGLNRNWQYGCPHVLYGQGAGRCNASKIAASTDFTVDAVDGPLVYLAAVVSGLDMQDYVGGLFEWKTEDDRQEVRTILRVEDDGQLLLGGTALELDVGMVATLALGCNHLTDDCDRLHNNSPNFGGQPYIPLQNPVGIKNTFY